METVGWQFYEGMWKTCWNNQSLELNCMYFLNIKAHSSVTLKFWWEFRGGFFFALCTVFGHIDEQFSGVVISRKWLFSRFLRNFTVILTFFAKELYKEFTMNIILVLVDIRGYNRVKGLVWRVYFCTFIFFWRIFSKLLSALVLSANLRLL